MAELFTVEISGADAVERGRQYGEAARPQIARSLEFYAEVFERSTGLRWRSLTERTESWVGPIRDYSPAALDEVRGIAEGAGRGFHEILALNGRGELTVGIQVPLTTSNGSIANGATADGCTSFAMLPEANGAGRVWAGQNWDWRDEIADTVVMLRVEQPGKPTIIAQVEAGQIGRHGANSAGLALNANGLGGDFTNPLGVPGTFIRRRILESWDMYDALEAAFDVRQALSSNLLLTHRDGFAIDLETTPGRHAWMYPENGLLVHGNHFEAFVPSQIEGSYQPFSVDSLFRVPRIREGLQRCLIQGSSPGSVRELVKSAMSDHFGYPNSLCTHADARKHRLDRDSTIVSSLVDLTSGQYYAIAGLPCRGDYELLPWNLYDGPGADQRQDLTARGAA